jgi:hypothetical protein
MKNPVGVILFALLSSEIPSKLIKLSPLLPLLGPMEYDECHPFS